jgi:uncharacterized protein YcbX
VTYQSTYSQLRALDLAIERTVAERAALNDTYADGKKASLTKQIAALRQLRERAANGLTD